MCKVTLLHLSHFVWRRNFVPWCTACKKRPARAREPRHLYPPQINIRPKLPRLLGFTASFKLLRPAEDASPIATLQARLATAAIAMKKKRIECLTRTMVEQLKSVLHFTSIVPQEKAPTTAEKKFRYAVCKYHHMNSLIYTLAIMGIMGASHDGAEKSKAVNRLTVTTKAFVCAASQLVQVVNRSTRMCDHARAEPKKGCRFQRCFFKCLKMKKVGRRLTKTPPGGLHRE